MLGWNTEKNSGPNEIGVTELKNGCFYGVFFAIFRPVSATLLQFAVLQILVVQQVRNNIFLLSYAKMLSKVVGIGQNSPPDDFNIPFKSHDLSQIFDQNRKFWLKIGESWIFDTGTLIQIVSAGILS